MAVTQTRHLSFQHDANDTFVSVYRVNKDLYNEKGVDRAVPVNANMLMVFCVHNVLRCPCQSDIVFVTSDITSLSEARAV